MKNKKSVLFNFMKTYTSQFLIFLEPKTFSTESLLTILKYSILPTIRLDTFTYHKMIFTLAREGDSKCFLTYYLVGSIR